MALPLPRYRFTVQEYYRMARAGIFTEDDRVELIEGEIIQMAPIGPGHGGEVIGLTHQFMERLADVALVSVQNPVRLSQYNEPVPDLQLLRPRPDHYRSRHPGPKDVLLLVEVADTTFAYDRRVKVPLYARHGIPEVWLVHLRRREVLVFPDPGSNGYGTAFTVKAGDSLAPLAFPDRGFEVRDLLGG